MSSSYVRTQVKQFLADNSGESVIDLTSDFQEIKELLADNNIQPDAPWLGLEFIGGEEIPIALAATNDQGLYREFGSLQLHVVTTAKLGAGDGLVSRAEALQNLFRGSRIGSIVIESMTKLNTLNGATLAFESGYMSGSFLVNYHRDLNL